MGKGYAEGPAAEEAERRRAELEEVPGNGGPRLREAVVGCTPEHPERHVIGWVGEVDPDELFASGRAWGIRIERRPDDAQSRATPGS